MSPHVMWVNAFPGFMRAPLVIVLTAARSFDGLIDARLHCQLDTHAFVGASKRMLLKCSRKQSANLGHNAVHAPYNLAVSIGMLLRAVTRIGL